MKEEQKRLSDITDVQSSSISLLLNRNDDLQAQLDEEVKARQDIDELYYDAIGDLDVKLTKLYGQTF